MADPTTPTTSDPTTAALLYGLLNFGGGALNAYGQAQQGDANRTLSLTELLAQLAQQGKGAALSSTQSDPAAESQGMFNALQRGQFAQNLRPSAIQAPYSLRGSVPQLSGGLMGVVPQNGLPASVTNALSPAAVLASANNFQKQQTAVNPSVPPMDLGPTFGTAGTAANTGNTSFQQSQLAQQQGLQNSLVPSGNAAGTGSLIGAVGTAAGLAAKTGLLSKVTGLSSTNPSAITAAQANAYINPAAGAAGATPGAAAPGSGSSVFPMSGAPGPSGPSSGPGSPGTFGSDATTNLNPNAGGTPGGLENIDPNGQTAMTPAQIAAFLRVMGGIPGGAYDNTGTNGSAATVGYF